MKKCLPNQILINGTRYYSVCRLDAYLFLYYLLVGFFPTIVAECTHILPLVFFSLHFAIVRSVCVPCSLQPFILCCFIFLAYVRDASTFERDAKGALVTMCQTIFLPTNNAHRYSLTQMPCVSTSLSHTHTNIQSDALS